MCRFRCVSKGWRDLISSPVFAAAHRSRHGPLLVDAGSFEEEEPVGGRDMRLMDMDGNVVRVIKGAGGYGMMCNTSLDGSSCGSVNVVNPATGELLVTCPQVDVMVRVLDDDACEILTLGDGRGWRKALALPKVHPCSRRGSPVTIDGIMYFLVECNNHSLLCLDLESEQWKPDVLEGPRKFVGVEMWRKTTAIRITELNGSLCMVQPVCGDIHGYNDDELDDPVTNIWILDNSDKRTWTKACTLPMAPTACRYIPLRVMHGGRKLLLHCSFDEGRSLVLQIYDLHTNMCTNIVGAPPNLAGRIGLCSFHLDNHNPVSAKNLLARFLDQAFLFFL
ncbi:hypothetical protein VPH35_058048 [Triticum aestivum]